MKRYLPVFLTLSLFMTSMLTSCSRPLADTGTEPKAAIIDQISVFESGSTFVSEAADMLASAGYKVDVWQGQAVTLDLYRELPRYGYKLIVFRTHLSFYYPESNPDISLIQGTALFTGETYSTTKHIADQLGDTIVKGHFADSSSPVFAINPKFITDTMKDRFDGTVILMMGCISYYLDDMAEAFIQKGASTYIGWNSTITLDYLDRATADLMDNLFIKQLNIETAIMQTMAMLGPDPYCGARLRYYPADKGDQAIISVAR